MSFLQQNKYKVIASTSANACRSRSPRAAIATIAMYEDDAVMVIIPFGTFSGKEEIHTFRTDLVSKGFDGVIYTNTVTTIFDEQSAHNA